MFQFRAPLFRRTDVTLVFQRAVREVKDLSPILRFTKADSYSELGNIHMLKISTLTIILWSMTFIGCGDASWNIKNIQNSQSRAVPIIKALEKYKDDRGRYPDSLAELVPKYIVQIDPPTAGDGKWRYRTLKDVLSYSLVFAGKEEFPEQYEYVSYNRKWVFIKADDRRF